MAKMKINKNDVKKINCFYRSTCGIVSICSIIALLGSLFFGFKDSILVGALGASVSIFMLYICIPILFTGYPPKFLYWTMDKKGAL